MLFSEHLNHLYSYVVLLFESLLLYLLLQVGDALEESLDLAGLHLLQRLDLGRGSRIALFVLLDLLYRSSCLQLELLRLPLKHHDHLIFLVFEHLS